MNLFTTNHSHTPHNILCAFLLQNKTVCTVRNELFSCSLRSRNKNRFGRLGIANPQRQHIDIRWGIGFLECTWGATVAHSSDQRKRRRLTGLCHNNLPVSSA
jgi:hypothetical protein